MKDEQMDESHYQRPDIQKIIAAIEKDDITPAEYARMKDEYAEEELRAKEKGEAEEQARLQGEQIGLEKGELEGKKKTALRMLAKGMDIEAVADLADLPLEVVKLLQCD